MKLTNLLQIVLLKIAIISRSSAFSVSQAHCQKNVSDKYQVPVTKTRQNQHQITNELLTYTEQYVDYEERTRWQTVRVCCPGYRTIIFALCEPICEDACPAHSYCAEPNKCVCVRGYEPSHHPNKEHQLICRPICTGGCPEHSHCVAHNECECRPGFKDVSSWFSSMRCERIHCAADQRYDLVRRICVKIDISMEDLMRKVAEKLAKGLDRADTTATEADAEYDTIELESV